MWFFITPFRDYSHTKFLPNLTGQSFFIYVEWDLPALPTRFSCLGIINPAKYSSMLVYFISPYNCSFWWNLSCSNLLLTLLKFWCLSLLLNNKLSVLTINYWLIYVMWCQLVFLLSFNVPSCILGRKTAVVVMA